MTAQILPRISSTAGCANATPTGWWARLTDLLLRRAVGSSAASIGMGLATGQFLRLQDAAGWTVVCRSGAVWITQESDVRDIFLKAGERLTLERGGLTLGRACRDALLVIRPPFGAGPKQNLPRPADVVAQQPSSASGEPLTWLRSLYPESGPWNEPASYRRSGLL